MKNKVLSGLMALVLILPFSGVHEIRANQGWQAAYSELLLSNMSRLGEYNFFFLHDIDLDGAPELFLYLDDGYESINGLYTFKDGKIMPVIIDENGYVQNDDFLIAYLLSLSSRMELNIPDDNSPGLVAHHWSLGSLVGGRHYAHLRYILNGDRLVTVNHLERNIEISEVLDMIYAGIISSDDEKIPELLEERTTYSIDGRTVPKAEYDDAYRDYFPSGFGEDLRDSMLPITTANIVSEIFAEPQANRHPYAKALQEFFSDAVDETGAYLVNIQGAGEAVYAWKNNAADGGVNTIFWLYNGELRSTSLTGLGAGSFYMVTPSGRLATAESMWASYSWIENGQLVHGNSFGIDEFTELDGDVMSRYSGHADDSGRILAMTTDTPAPSQNNAISVTVNGQKVNFANQQPTIVDGRTLVPVRGVFEGLGFDVSWNDRARQVTLSRAGDTIIITIDRAAFTVNGVSRTLDVPAQILGGSTMLPIRPLIEAMGYSVDWNENTRTVIILTIPPSE